MEELSVPAKAWPIIWPCLIVLAGFVTWEVVGRWKVRRSARKHQPDLRG